MAESRTWEIWVGAYASERETGITRIEFDGATGDWVKTNEYGGLENPTFLALNRSGTVLYAVSEIMEVEGQPGGRMIAYPIEAGTRKLQAGWERLTYGAAPCHVSLDPDERWVAAANYFGSGVTLYPLHPDGKPGDAMVRLRHLGSGPHPDRQEMPHPHAAVFDPDGGRHLYVPDLGLDRVMIYELGEDGVEWTSSGTANVALEDGPRHLSFHPNGRSAFVVNELSSTVTRFTRTGSGKLERQETVSTLPGTFQGENTCAEIAVSPDGKFVYASNRGHDSIAVFRLDEADGGLIPSGHVSTRGRTPRSFAITPDGAWLIAANQDTNNLAVFRMEPHTGLPIFSGIEIDAGKPVCVLIHPL